MEEVESQLGTKDNLQADTENHLQVDTKDQLQADTKDQLQSDTKDQFQADTKDQLQSDTKDQLQADTKDQLQSDTKDQLQADTKDSSRIDTNEHLRVGHKYDAKIRTEDIDIDEAIAFSDIGLSPNIVKGLYLSGFERPSPIQLSAIPYGRCGLDLVVQAKSGTGKTCVFTIVGLESIKTNIKLPQVLILAPTREIALQIQQVIAAIGRQIPQLKCHCSIGGLSLKDDKAKVNTAHIVIGTPGRVKQLMELSALDCTSIRLFILDEADKLFEDSFQEQINWIYYGLPGSKQVIAASATFSEELVEQLCRYMHNPTFVRLSSNDPVLIGVIQYKRLVTAGDLPNESYNNKVMILMDILSKLNFQQCLIFSNLMTRAENLSKLMTYSGWPTVHIAGSLEQSERIDAINKLKTYHCRILVSTDLTARGIDADRVDLVINLDLPYDSETYLHRVGRAGRFGARGAAITLYTENEAAKLEEIIANIKTNIATLPDEFSAEIIHKPDQNVRSVKKLLQVESFQIMTSKRQQELPSNQKAKNLFNQSVKEEKKSGTASTSDHSNIQASHADHADIVNHRAPFGSLGDAIKFLDNPDKHHDMLDTTTYFSRMNININESSCLRDVDSKHADSKHADSKHYNKSSTYKQLPFQHHVGRNGDDVCYATGSSLNEQVFNQDYNPSSNSSFQNGHNYPAAVEPEERNELGVYTHDTLSAHSDRFNTELAPCMVASNQYSHYDNHSSVDDVTNYLPNYEAVQEAKAHQADDPHSHHVRCDRFTSFRDEHYCHDRRGCLSRRTYYKPRDAFSVHYHNAYTQHLYIMQMARNRYHQFH